MKPVTINGHRYYLNREKLTDWVAKNSLSKIERMVELIEEADCVFDVGANCGIFAALCAAKFPAAKIHAFEPSTSLQRVLARNCPSPNISLYPVAVGERDEEVTLYINPESQQTNSLHRSSIEPFTDRIDEQVAHCITLDSLGVEPDVLKIDVQGAEGAVFRGARTVLKAVRWLFVESSWLDPDAAQLVPAAQHYGFTHVTAVNPVHMGADLLFTREPVEGSARIGSQRWF